MLSTLTSDPLHDAKFVNASCLLPISGLLVRSPKQEVDRSLVFTFEPMEQGELPAVGFLLGLSANCVIQVYEQGF